MKKNSKIVNRKGMTPRQRQIIFRKVCLLFSIILVAVVLSVLIGGIGNKVKAADNYHKYYTSKEIKPGDTLSSYYEQYGENYKSIDDYITEVCMINSIEEDKVIAGNYIILPYYSFEVK